MRILDKCAFEAIAIPDTLLREHHVRIEVHVYEFKVIEFCIIEVIPRKGEEIVFTELDRLNLLRICEDWCCTCQFIST